MTIQTRRVHTKGDLYIHNIYIYIYNIIVSFTRKLYKMRGRWVSLLYNNMKLIKGHSKPNNL